MRKIDKEYAEKVLLKVNENPKAIDNKIGKQIEDILRGSHKTYRYVLVTALLAKSTDFKVDAFSLQAGDDSDGAYDARSLCHQVIVPFERTYYPNGLGGSNEPYLNKPARFTRLSEDNAVRRGNDLMTLKSVIEVLSSITSKDEAELYLSTAIYHIAQIAKEAEAKYQLPDLDIDDDRLPQTILDFVVELAGQSFEGETCPLIVSALEHLYYGGNSIIVPHKVNESGASSNEVGDIDIYSSSKELISSIEVKDKDFTKSDVEHAISKFAAHELEKSLFIFGKKVNFDHKEVFHTASELGKQGFYCAVISIEDYAKMRIYSMPNKCSVTELAQLMLDYAQQINTKDATVEWIKECATEFAL